MRRGTICVAGALWLAVGTVAASPGADPGNSVGASLGAVHETEKKPGAVGVEALKRRLADKDVTFGSPIMLRIFKHEAELEVWIQKGERFELFAVYPICNWSGKLGPKLAEGDRQSPEGLYSIGAQQLHRTGRWPRSLDIGYPNTYDKAHGRTGSFILVHGGCTSIGCFAMTDPAMEDIFALNEAALTHGQERIQVHVFPFRMTQANLDRHPQSSWAGFWLGLKKGYDLFEQTRIPPQVRVCDGRYEVGNGSDADNCVENVSEASVFTASVWNARRIANARNARRARLARKAARVRHARRRQHRNVRQAKVNRGGRMALGGPKPRRR